MSVVLSFNDKNGKPASITFPNRQVAEVYARGVKNPTFTDSETAVVATVTKCGTPEEEERKRNASVVESAHTGETGFHARGIALARAKKEKVERVCECGKFIAGDHTACYTCRRYR